MTCNKQKITKHDRFDIFRSSLEMVMSRILKDDNYLQVWSFYGNGG